MSDQVSLDTADLERLFFTIDTSIKVTKRFQFFLWAQGALQSFLPHETMICLVGDLGAMRLRHEVFSRALVAPELDEVIADRINGFVPAIVSQWVANDHAPLSFHEQSVPHDSLKRLMPGHLLCHGMRHGAGQFDSMFIFVRTPTEASRREKYLAELLMPHMHTAVHRVCTNENASRGTSHEPHTLSDREVQVLHWIRDGKTNHEIGQILGISPLTVKNHVQKILRKLNVANRAQAVAKAAAGGLFNGQVSARA